MPAILEGPAAAEALTRALGALTALVPHLTAAVDPPRPAPAADTADERGVPGDRVWVSSQELIDDPARLGRIVVAGGRHLGTDDATVAASAFVQSYSYRLLAVTVGCLCTAGVVPDASAPRTVVARSGPWPSLLGFVAPVVGLLDGGAPALARADSPTITDALGDVVAQCIDAHLHPLLASVRAGLGTPVGERLLWGDVAASAAVAFRTMHGVLGPGVEPLGTRFFALAPPVLHGLGSFR
ncbi:MAG: ferric iron reductase, partial [Acidimicrobiales bacterium]